MIDPTETKLEGKWKLINGKPVADPVMRKINMLISVGLVKVGSTDYGWTVL